ncbi:raffinose/stachyose/melibiose transport system permease protein [Aequitasia blattaphilus]|uniref:Carbohydrate ABC transporter permease n=2 Tax=Lachnospiraceae TaxID=186803 RepID=A0ABT1EK37_9FIRM|nr:MULTISPECIES: carbohydrate ABC transporter permease [Lachnospiraceae]MCP1103673.1 carbohydrate ABC transporter permease [Aequitasia blattaphilus]MCP1111069.1 carbohydrate ABC transporter permease [Ohessyouella blattaphilus]MCR8564463.1 carbohydrate ABC transporter permease [Ohessyouella blattaphilus]MCR8616313.1 carbohydrate ABC transporter permease [Aequitasia blattaphilus]
MKAKEKRDNLFLTIIIGAIALLFLVPIIIIVYNSFKGTLFISSEPFALPRKGSFVGLDNYIKGIAKTGLIGAFGWSLFITVFSVGLIVLCTSMTAWYITRVKGKITSILYYLFVFAMIVPFQMVMFSMSKMANMLYLDNPVGIIFIYLGYGAGLSIFIFAGFVKAIPLEIEEAAYIDGCNPWQTYFKIVFPLLRPTAITVAILNAMWIWNDYLLPKLILPSEIKTIPIAIQYLRDGYGGVDMGHMMAMLVIAIIPIVIFYLSCQKYIIRGVAAGAVKG